MELDDLAGKLAVLAPVLLGIVHVDVQIQVAVLIGLPTSDGAPGRRGDKPRGLMCIEECEANIDERR